MIRICTTLTRGTHWCLEPGAVVDVEYKGKYMISKVELCNGRFCDNLGCIDTYIELDSLPWRTLELTKADPSCDWPGHRRDDGEHDSAGD